MKVAYFDCLAGASGDMILGALLDAGLAESILREGLQGLNLTGYELHIRQAHKNGLRATKVDVVAADDAPVRRLADILALLHASSLPPTILDQAVAICYRLGEVEALVHGVPVEQVHLHELGGVDTIVDITGALIGLAGLGIERVYSSPLPLSRGFTQGAHGRLPLPAPATLALLKGVPITGSDVQAELVTPTGAALLTALARSFGPIPAMRLLATGYGAGGRDLPIPNVLRILIGDQADDQPGAAAVQRLTVLETNLDDMNPQAYEHILNRLFQGGALDVTFTPLQRKKNRPAILVTVLCEPEQAGFLAGILFSETTTLGIRKHDVERLSLPRSSSLVSTPYGEVQVKIAILGENKVKFSPEYEDCRALAEQHSIPLREVYQAAMRAAEKQLQPTSSE